MSTNKDIAGIAGALILGPILIGTILFIAGDYLEVRGYEEGYLAGKEAKVLELAEVFAPYGYQKIRQTKIGCEVKYGVVCQIYGGFAPKMEVKRETNTKKSEPL